MPAIPPQQLVTELMNAFASAGCTGQLASAIRSQPRRFVVTGPDAATVITIYAWTLTFGGRANLPDEYRIQMTSVKSPLQLADDGPTVLLGYDPELNLFAGFDLEWHREFTTGSPSVQIDREDLRTAETEGLSFCRKSNDEIAVGIRPDMLMSYINEASTLHRNGKNATVLRLLIEAVSAMPLKTELQDLSIERKRIITEVSRLSRAANFRQRVLFAYGNRCAVTRMQLRLVDAAHILPVGVQGSSDNVSNGVALSPTYHRAFDAGLIYLDENYRMVLNEAKLALLSANRLNGGLQPFRTFLGERIFLPPDIQQRPSVVFIRRANQFRQISV